MIKVDRTGSTHDHEELNRTIVDWTVQKNAGQYGNAHDNTLLYKTILEQKGLHFHKGPDMSK